MMAFVLMVGTVAIVLSIVFARQIFTRMDCDERL